MQLTRRAFAAGAISVAALGRARAADVDVAIVGAGAAGLAAAKRVAAAGRTFVVLEARSRIGGRAFTDASLGVPFDAGAEYIHWGERNPWKRIAEDLGVPIDDQERPGNFAAFRAGKPVPEAERARRRAAFGAITRSISAVGEGDRSFADLVRGGAPELVDAAGGITRMALGEEPDTVSVRDYDQLWSGDDYVVPSGYGALVARFGAAVPVRLDNAVTRIAWGGRTVELDTAAGTVAAATAIVTVPIGVLKAGSLRFVPDLPPPAEAALAGLHMGALTKIALRLDRARLGTVPATDYFDLGPDGTTVAFEFFPHERDLCLAALGGDGGRAACAMGEAGAVAFATDRLASMLGGRVRDAITGGRLAGWWTDPHALGSYSIVDPGHVGAREALRIPVGDRVFIAGEATAGGGAMTVGGAYLEGERAADAALRLVDHQAFTTVGDAALTAPGASSGEPRRVDLPCKSTSSPEPCTRRP
jgi:monoamine oxidase